mgnify:CR=1 FL=1
MILYHGSNVEVPEPKIVRSVRTLDFGSGFYTTANRKQAENFSLRITPKRGTGAPTVSCYEFDEKALVGFRTKDFPALEALKVRKLYNQYVFKSEAALAALRFVGSEVIHG